MSALVSVVVPFYNEEDNVAPLADRVAAVFESLPEYEYECLFVNDGSTDGTRARIKAAQAQNARIKPVNLVKNSGQSAALVAGMRRANGDYILTLDGDLQNDPGDFPNMLAMLKEFDCVCGYRQKRQDTWVRRISSRIANAVRQSILHDGIRDAGCGSKGFRRACVQHIVPFNGVHRYFAIVVRNGGLTVAECPVTHYPRLHGVSKYGIHNRLWRGIYDLFGVRWLSKRYVTFQIEDEKQS